MHKLLFVNFMTALVHKTYSYFLLCNVYSTPTEMAQNHGTSNLEVCDSLMTVETFLLKSDVTYSAL